eukprot:1220322-Rhodomonas_salina.2
MQEPILRGSATWGGRRSLSIREPLHSLWTWQSKFNIEKPFQVGERAQHNTNSWLVLMDHEIRSAIYSATVSPSPPMSVGKFLYLGRPSLTSLMREGYMA